MKRAVLLACFAFLPLTQAACANGLASTDDFDAGKTEPQWPDASSTRDAGAIDARDAGSGDAGDCKADLAEPWSGAGVSTAWINQSVLTVVSGDRYWTYDYGTGAWGTTGHLETLWAGVLPIDGLLPWQDVGVHATYVVGTTLTIISGDRYWTVDTGTHIWGTTGHIATLWSSAPSNGGFLPWNAPDVQTAYPYQSGLTIISADRYWIQNLTNGTWTTGALESSWAGAPKVDSDLPWESSGVSASWVYGTTQTILSGDRYWIANVTNGTWTDTGHLETVWSTVPPVDGCK